MNKYLKEMREDTYKILSIILFFLLIVSGWYVQELKSDNKRIEKMVLFPENETLCSLHISMENMQNGEVECFQISDFEIIMKFIITIMSKKASPYVGRLLSDSMGMDSRRLKYLDYELKYEVEMTGDGALEKFKRDNKDLLQKKAAEMNAEHKAIREARKNA